MALGWPWGGLGVALGGLSVQGSGFRVQGSMLDVGCSMFSRPHRQSTPRHSHPPCLKIENAGTAPLRACRHRLKSITVGSKYTEPSRNFVVPASVVLYVSVRRLPVVAFTL